MELYRNQKVEGHHMLHVDLLIPQDEDANPYWVNLGVPISQVLNIQPPDWLIPGYVPKQSLTVVAGQPASYKSFLALDWALRSARDGSRVYYVIAEGLGGFGKRVRAWLEANQVQYASTKENGWKDPEKWLGNIRFWPEAIDLLDWKTVHSCIKDFEEARPVDLLVVDTYARSIPGADENSAGDAGKAVKAIDDMRYAARGACLVVHHFGKQANGMRGSSALQGAADSVIHVKRDGNAVEIHIDKMKDSEPIVDKWMAFQPVPGTDSGVLVDHAPDLFPQVVEAKFCEECGAEFIPNSPKQKYCDDACRQKAGKRRRS